MYCVSGIGLGQIAGEGVTDDVGGVPTVAVLVVDCV